MKLCNDLDGRTVVLTGGGGYLGRAMAAGLASLGMHVIICGRSEVRLTQASEFVKAQKVRGAVSTVVADVSDEKAISLLIERAISISGKVDGWINNAASSSFELLGDVTPSGVQKTIANSLGQTMMATQAAASLMAENGGGSIINVASMYGMVSPQPSMYRDYPSFHNPPAYGAAKAGIIQFTRYAACHYGDAGVRVNCISPGPFPKESVRDSAGFKAELSQRVPLGRVGHAAEIVGPVAFLLSDLSSYVTGHNLVVDGGWTAW